MLFPLLIWKLLLTFSRGGFFYTITPPTYTLVKVLHFKKSHTMKEHCLLEKTLAFAIIISFYLSVTEFFTFDEGIELLYRIYTWKFEFSCFLSCRLMIVMSFRCNLILIETMENIYHLMLIGMSAIFTHFIGNISSVSAVYVADSMFFGHWD